MNKLILCEGETDAILLSYYLSKVAGWVFCKKAPKNLEISRGNSNESVNWYKKGEDYLLICGVGGKNNFGSFFKTKIKPPLVTVSAFEKIAIVTDRDDRTIDDIKKSLINSMDKFFTNMQDREWCENNYTDAFGMGKTVQLLLSVIPKKHAGALETVILEAIAEDPYDKNIVEKTAVFVEKMRAEAEKYIGSERLQLKAHLGVTWAVQYPEKVFSLIDEQIRNVPWEKYESLKECFGMVAEI